MSLEPRPAKLTGFASFDHIQVVAPLNVASNGGGYANNHLDIAPALASLVLSFCTLQTLGARSISREQQIRSARPCLCVCLGPIRSSYVPSPHPHAGTDNMGGQVMGWATPWVIGALTPYPNGESREQIEAANGTVTDAWLRQLGREWRTTFLLGGCCNMVGAAAYLALASDQVQPWARLPGKRDSGGGGGGGRGGGDGGSGGGGSGGGGKGGSAGVISSSRAVGASRI